MRIIWFVLVMFITGCADSSAPKPVAEWFIVVSSELSQDVHDRFADELKIFTEQYAIPGEVIHVMDGAGLLSLTFIADFGSDAQREAREASEYFTAGTHIEGHDGCAINFDTLESRMRQIRLTDAKPRVILLGSERPHRYLDFGCECENRPHSLLKEYFSESFHPEFTVPTKTELDFKMEWGL